MISRLANREIILLIHWRQWDIQMNSRLTTQTYPRVGGSHQEGCGMISLLTNREIFLLTYCRQKAIHMHSRKITIGRAT